MTHSAVIQDEQENRKLLHDLRGPLINAAAFNKELTDAIEHLCNLLGDENTELSTAQRSKITEILREDLTPCNQYVQSAVTQMQERLDQFDS